MNFNTIGKFCIQNEKLAKTYVSAFARELEYSEDPIVRNNAMMILCDLCTRYARVVDPYIPIISSCLRDPFLLVRRQTLASNDFVSFFLFFLF